MLAGLLLALLVAGCQRQSATPPPTQEVDAATAARQAMERGDWAGAARLLREALRRDPENLSLHYGLATSATHLNARDEAVREFQWVMAHAPEGSQEFKAARSWLVEAGVLDRPTEGQERTTAADERPDAAELSGHVVWAEAGEASVPQRRLQLHLIGLPKTSTEDQRYILRTDEEGSYLFKSVVPGPYQLTNRIAGQPIWRLRVQIEPGQRLQLDLTPENSVKARDDFPETARPSG